MRTRLGALIDLIRPFMKPTQVPALLAGLAILVVGFLADSLYDRVHMQQKRAEVASHVSLIRARMEGIVNGNIQLVRGLVATVSVNPDITEAGFSELAANLLGDNPQIRHIAAAPDLVVRWVYPYAGNEAAIGLDYLQNEAQRAAVLRVRDTRRMLLAGPVDLVQGGAGLIARFPVMVNDGRGDKRFWGIVSAIIDLERLYDDSGLVNPALPVEITITGRDASGARGERFYGAADVVTDDPVTAFVSLPNGSWQIAARPRGGWGGEPEGSWALRILILAAAALILVPTITTGRLMEERSRNIGELKRRKSELELMSRRLELALDSSHIGVWELNTETNVLYWDDRTNELFGYPPDGNPRSYDDWRRRIHPDDLAQLDVESSEAFARGESYHIEYRLVLPDGTMRHIRESSRAHRDPGGPLRIVGVNWDVTADVKLKQELLDANSVALARNVQLETAKARIEYTALHDALTGLPNRRYLDEMLARHVQRFETDGERLGLLHIDLDRFKQINDTLGHAAGDAMLIHTADVLSRNLGDGDFVARVGGDEFVVLCSAGGRGRAAWHEHLAGLAERIIAAMHQPVQYEGHECRVGVSVGIASDVEAQADPRRLLSNADMALYRAKSRGRNRYQFFNEALQAEVVTTKRIADEILSGIERGEFVPYYQPQVDAATHEIIGVEALARWKHPTEGLLAPHTFLRIAEELNVVATIDRMILERTLADFRRWQAAGLAIPKASVNVSARRLHDEELIRSLRKMRIEPGTISFELVESIFLDENDELVTWNVEQIKSLGIDIEIDDFGTGHASIVSLLKLKPRRLKIARPLIMPVLRSPGQKQLVGSIIDIGRSLGIEVLGEGVETMEHARILRNLGCSALQGHAFARAMPEKELRAFVAARRLSVAS